MNPKRHLAVIAICSALGFVPQATSALMHASLNWTGMNGYSMHAEFDYDDQHAVVGTLTDSYAILGINSLWVSVFDPNGALLLREQNISASQNNYPYLSFAFDTVAKDFSALWDLDIGADPGYWLSGYWSNGNSINLSLTMDLDGENYGNPTTIDSGGTYVFTSGAYTVTDGSPTLLLAALAIAVLGLAQRRHQFALC